jgi:hypothetical protein
VGRDEWLGKGGSGGSDGVVDRCVRECGGARVCVHEMGGKSVETVFLCFFFPWTERWTVMLISRCFSCPFFSQLAAMRMFLRILQASVDGPLFSFPFLSYLCNHPHPMPIPPIHTVSSSSFYPPIYSVPMSSCSSSFCRLPSFFFSFSIDNR